MRSLSTFRFAPYQGQIFRRAAGFCDGDVAVATINWATYWAQSNTANQRVGVSLQSGTGSDGSQGVIKKIVSIRIDNTNSALPCYVSFPDASDVITCPPYASITASALTNQLSCEIGVAGLQAGALPTVSVTFMPFYMPPMLAPELPLVYPQELGSPVIQNNASQILTAGFASRALGDQLFSVDALSLTAPGAVVSVFNTPRASGFIYITACVFRAYNIASGVVTQEQVVLESTGTAGILFNWIFTSGGLQPSLEIENISGLQLKIDATQTWRIRNITAAGTSGTGIWRFAFTTNDR